MPTGMVIDSWHVLHVCWRTDDILRSTRILSFRQCNHALHSWIKRHFMVVLTTANDAFTIPRKDLDSRLESFGTMHEFHVSKHWNWWLQQQTRFRLWNRSKGNETFRHFSKFDQLSMIILYNLISILNWYKCAKYEMFSLQILGSSLSTVLANRHRCSVDDQWSYFVPYVDIFVYFLLVFEITPSSYATFAAA